MQYLKNSSIKRRWASLLALILLFQAFFPLQAHTRLVVDDHGRVVELCTLQGLTAVPLDGSPSEESSDRGTRSPAVAFSTVMCGAIPNIVGPAVVAASYSYAAPVTYLAVAAAKPRTISSPIRAPPYS